jgi:hypothetical protein
MSIIAKSNGEKEFSKIPLPEAGTVQAVCCAVWDLGLQETNFLDEKTGKNKVQHKIIIAWEIEQKIDQPDSEYHGKPYMLNKKYTLSLGDKATLRHDLESWRGKAFPADQVTSGFDVEQLYGVNCLLGITHTPDKYDPSKVYANVSALLPPTKNMAKLIPVRARDELPPKWVVEKMAQAKDNARLIQIAEPEDEFPFGDPAMDEPAPGDYARMNA